MRSDGDILGDVKGSARRHKLSSATATSRSIPFEPFEHMWEPEPDADADAFRPGQVRHHNLPDICPLTWPFVS